MPKLTKRQLDEYDRPTVLAMAQDIAAREYGPETVRALATEKYEKLVQFVLDNQR